MIVLKATPQQAQNLEGKYFNNSELKFIEDKNGNLVVNKNILSDPDFEEIKSQLETLEEIDYNPKEILD